MRGCTRTRYPVYRLSCQILEVLACNKGSPRHSWGMMRKLRWPCFHRGADPGRHVGTGIAHGLFSSIQRPADCITIHILFWQINGGKGFLNLINCCTVFFDDTKRTNATIRSRHFSQIIIRHKMNCCRLSGEWGKLFFASQPFKHPIINRSGTNEI